MSCLDIAGKWGVGRLLLDGAADAVEDVRLILKTPDGNGNFEGSFMAPDGTPIPDRLLNGRCLPNGIKHQIEFTREHVGGAITTSYSGRVILVQPTGEVLIRGRFTRTTALTAGLPTIAVGDHETEKPT